MLNSLVRLGLRRRFAFVALVCLGLLLFSFTLLPSRSGAKVQSPSKAKSKRSRFVPGEVLVRYRSESTAERKTGEDSSWRPEKVDKLPHRLNVSKVLISSRDCASCMSLLENTLSAVAALRTPAGRSLRRTELHFPRERYSKRSTSSRSNMVSSKSVRSRFGTISQQEAQTSSSLLSIRESTSLTRICKPTYGPTPFPARFHAITGDLHGYNFVNNSGNVFSNTDAETHATHVAGIIGAVGNNTQGIAGVNWTVRLMSLKFLDIFKGGRYGQTPFAPADMQRKCVVCGKPLVRRKELIFASSTRVLEKVYSRRHFLMR